MTKTEYIVSLIEADIDYHEYAVKEISAEISFTAYS